MLLSVIIPAYREGGRISHTLDLISDYLSRQDYGHEIIVVDDGSSDDTADKVQESRRRIQNLRLLDNQKNHGKGWAVRQGMLKARGDYRLFMDADSSTAIEELEKFWPYIRDEHYDVVIGSIEIAGARINEQAQWYRRALGHWSKYLIRVVAGLWSIHDTQRGFKLFTAESAEAIFKRATVRRFGFDIEVLALAKRLQYRIKEVPVIWNNPSESRVSLMSYAQVLMDLFRIRWNLWVGKYRI